MIYVCIKGLKIFHFSITVPKSYKEPVFLEELEALLTADGTVSLECKVVGVPTPVLHWYKDGQLIRTGEFKILTYGQT